MGKESPIDRESKTARKNKRLRSSSSKYLKPGTLAHLRYNKASASKFCTDLGKKRVAVDTKKAEDDNVLMENKVIEESPLMLSPVNFHKQNGLVRTPKTPRAENFESESRLESLPMDLLVKILCHLHHDQLRAVFHVSQRIRKAVSQARQFHFNYTTPDRSRQEVLSTMTPRPTDHWPFMSKGEGKGIMLKSPHTPKAPRHGPRPPSRVKVTELRQIAAVLFQDSAFPSRCMVPSTLPKPLFKSLASNRVLFYEDELCQAVAQNKLR
ncbi:F-box protein [Gossypium australe]|uniref:F-box protein n=1 Tax=Gossypium australe TaxID=47621 RepID=A0A5B6UK35_9ROSI|nr:F-box protein [Gossypium australe]